MCWGANRVCSSKALPARTTLPQLRAGTTSRKHESLRFAAVGYAEFSKHVRFASPAGQIKVALWVGRGSKEMLLLKTAAPRAVQPSRGVGAAAPWCQLDPWGWE